MFMDVYVFTRVKVYLKKFQDFGIDQERVV